MSKVTDSPFSSLKHHFLLAMPGLHDPNFEHAVVYLCEHTEEGAMGFIINHQLDIPAKAIFAQMDLDYGETPGNQPIFDGGPVQRERGFILHRSSDKHWESTMALADDLCLTASKDILADIASGDGPRGAMITLGYSGWSAGQLEAEIADNAWLTIPASSAIIFDTECDAKASAAAATIGLDLNMLSSDSGHA